MSSARYMHDFASGSMAGKPGHVPMTSLGSQHPHANLGKYLHPKKG